MDNSNDGGLRWDNRRGLDKIGSIFLQKNEDRIGKQWKINILLYKQWGDSWKSGKEVFSRGWIIILWNVFGRI